jgi:hypothetical protein
MRARFVQHSAYFVNRQWLAGDGQRNAGQGIASHLYVVAVPRPLRLPSQQLGKSVSPAKGRDLIKQVRKQLLELARPMLESLVHEIAGVKVLSMHHDISTVTGEEVVILTLADAPRFQ